MSRRRTILPPVLVCGLLSLLAGCGRPPERGIAVDEFDVRLLTDAVSVRSRLGEPLGGYLAQYELNFEMRRIFIALDILKYEKGESLMVKGTPTDDSVRMSYADQIDAEFRVIRVLKAEPPPLRTDIDKPPPVIRLPR